MVIYVNKFVKLYAIVYIAIIRKRYDEKKEKKRRIIKDSEREMNVKKWKGGSKLGLGRYNL